jgi:pyruvate/2-oxoglutarate dehydrogenase complex dihydrolipoamide acyltransferase (E2) component
VLEIVLTREDANTEFALLAEWLVEDRAEVTQGQPVCVVETTKATVEIESPGIGTIVQLFAEDVEVELGKTIAYVAETAAELAALDAREAEKPTPKPAGGDRKATRKAVELAELHGIDLSAIDKRGFITEKDVEDLIARQKATESPEH